MIPSDKVERPDRPDFTDCNRCPYKKHMLEGNWVPSKVPENTDLILVTDMPGREEVLRAKPLFGRVGDRVHRIFKELNIPANRVHKTSAILCYKGGKDKTKHRDAAKCCRMRLYRELQATGCKHVVVAGELSLWTLSKRTPLGSWCGDMFPGAALEKPKKRYRDRIWKKKVLPNGEQVLLFKKAKAVKQYINNIVNFKHYNIHPNQIPSVALVYDEKWRAVFKTWLERAWELANGTLQRKEWGENCIEVGDRMLELLQGYLSSKKPISMDVETYGEGSGVPDPFDCKMDLLGFSDGESAVSIPWDSIDLGDMHHAGIQEYGDIGFAIRKIAIELLITTNIPKVYQNGLYDISVIYYVVGIDILSSYGFEDMVAHALIAPWMQHNLGLQAAMEFPLERWKSRFKVGTPERAVYNCRDCFTTIWLSETHKQRLSEAYPALQQLYNEKHQEARIAIKMYRRGVEINLEALEEHRTRLLTEMDEIAEKLKEFVPADLNIGSDIQLKKLIFGDWGVASVDKTAGGAIKLDKTVLEKLTFHPEERVSKTAKLLREYRRRNKQITTYLGLRLDENNLYHESYNVCSSRTNRWGGKIMLTTPKAQTMQLSNGKTVILAPTLRNMFQARDGYWLMKADYDQQELKFIVYLANEPILKKAFEEGVDLHKLVGSILMRKPIDQVSPEERQFMKIMEYGGFYGGSYQTLYKSAKEVFPGTTLRFVRELHNELRKNFQNIMSYMDGVVDKAMKTGIIEAPICGRKQIYVSRDMVDPNEVVNYPIQTSGMDLTRPALIEIDQKIDWENTSIWNVLHDEIVLEGNNPYEMYDLLMNHMQRTVELNGEPVTFTIECKFGKVWSALKTVRNHDNIKKLL